MARETWVQSQVESYQRLKKWYLMPPCLTLSIIRYGSRVKWSNPGKGVAPSPTPWCSKLSKREPSGHPRLWSPTLLTYLLLQKSSLLEHPVSIKFSLVEWYEGRDCYGRHLTSRIIYRNPWRNIYQYILLDYPRMLWCWYIWAEQNNCGFLLFQTSVHILE